MPLFVLYVQLVYDHRLLLLSHRTPNFILVCHPTSTWIASAAFLCCEDLVWTSRARTRGLLGVVAALQASRGLTVEGYGECSYRHVSPE